LPRESYAIYSTTVYTKNISLIKHLNIVPSGLNVHLVRSKSTSHAPFRKVINDITTVLTHCKPLEHEQQKLKTVAKVAGASLKEC
jgi:uracil phosphoribosyltransferase